MPKYRNKLPRPLTIEERHELRIFFADNTNFFHYIYSLFSLDKDYEDDIIQECQFRIICNIDTFLSLDDDHRKKYVVPIIQNLCIDAARRKNKLKIVPLNDDTITIEEPAFSDTHLLINLLASKLSDKDWYLLKGIYLDGVPDEELAEHMNCGINSLRMLASRARKRAQKILNSSIKGGDDSCEIIKKS